MGNEHVTPAHPQVPPDRYKLITHQDMDLRQECEPTGHLFGERAPLLGLSVRYGPSYVLTAAVGLPRHDKLLTSPFFMIVSGIFVV